MKPRYFRQLGIKLFGPKRGWQTRCAKAFGTGKWNVCRWANGSVRIPGPVIMWMKNWERQGKVVK